MSKSFNYTYGTIKTWRWNGDNLSFFDNASLDVNSDYIDEAKKIIDKNGVDMIRISPYHGFKKGSLDFILDVKKLRGIHIYRSANVDISAIEKRTDLEYLRIAENKQRIDLSHLSNLLLLTIDWHKKIKLPLPDNSRLEFLLLGSFSEKTLLSLPCYTQLAWLSICGGSIVSLDGLERFKNLRIYEHRLGKKLHDISKLVELPNLKELELNLCKNIEIEDIFERCKKLKILKYLGCADLPSLAFIKKMKRIEDFRFGGTNILDGDLTPLLQLKDFGFYPNKRHYSHTYEKLKQIHAEERND